MNRLIIVFLSLFVMFQIPAFGFSFRWADDDGVIHFTNDYKLIPEKNRKDVKTIQTENVRDDYDDPSTPPAMLNVGEPAIEKSETVVYLEKRGKSLIVRAMVNNKKSKFFLLDTGATYSAVTPEFARELGLGLKGGQILLNTANGQIEAPMGKLTSLKIGNAEVRNLEVVMHSLGLGDEIAGVVGLNYLNNFTISLDPSSGKFSLKR